MIDSLIDFLGTEFLYSTIVFVVVYLLSRLFPKQTPAFMHGIWVLVLLRLVLPTSLSFDFSLRSLFDWISGNAVEDLALTTFGPDGLEILTSHSDLAYRRFLCRYAVFTADDPIQCHFESRGSLPET